MENEFETVDGIAVRGERPEFDPADLLACGRCGRPNAPNRAECIYCGNALAIGAGAADDLTFRAVEPWEKAFNIVVVGGRAERTPANIELEVLKSAFDLGPPVPIKRVATAEAAGALSERINESGLESVVVSDEELAADRPPVRLRSVNFSGDRSILTTFNTNEKIEFPAAALELIVVGRSFEERAEQTIKKKMKGVKELDGRSMSKDFGVIDIYLSAEPTGFRVSENGFDFSGLGEGKTFLAAENMKLLVEILVRANQSVIVSSDYLRKRTVLDDVWPLAVRNDSKGIQRVGLGISFAKAEVVSNIEQFTKYSRLVRRTL